MVLWKNDMVFFEYVFQIGAWEQFQELFGVYSIIKTIGVDSRTVCGVCCLLIWNFVQNSRTESNILNIYSWNI